MVGLGIAYSQSVIRNLAIIGSFADMSQLLLLAPGSRVQVYIDC
jgi:hypothetical protein